jgi:hypothetical protein
MKNKNFSSYSKRKVWNRIVLEELVERLFARQASIAVIQEQLPTTKRCRIVFLIASFEKMCVGIATHITPH